MISLHNGDSYEGSLRDLAPDLTPMLDIMFILLVFFMLTAGAAFETLTLQLPSSLSEELSLINEPKHIMLEIHENNYAVDGKEITNFKELKTSIISAIKNKPEHSLIIAGDKSISIEKLLRVLTYLQSQNIEAANILMQHEQK